MSCTVMYVRSYDPHYNALWGRYASELKGLTKTKIVSPLLPLLLLYNQLLHCNVMVRSIITYRWK